MTRSARWRIGALTTIVLLLSGCGAATQPAFAELANPQSDEDSILRGTEEDVDPDSVRYVGSHDGSDIYLAISAEPDTRGGVCMFLRTPDADGDTSSCSGGGEFTLSWSEFGALRFRPPASAGLEPTAGWVRISENVIVQPSS
ncbi:MAG: hypothetical protein ABWX76_14590 [Leifsonia flava]